MESEHLPRKLAAILYADVVGYSRLMGADESGTLARLKVHRKELIDPTIASHRGRMVKLMGDGALVEFASVVDALACAVDIQKGMKERNQNESAEQRIEFRIGINLGDVIVDGDDIYGDGVNIAARLESLADAGGICISESVRTAVGNKLSFGYESMGEQQVKNIAEPVRAYRVVLDSTAKSDDRSDKAPALESSDKPSIAVLRFTNMSADPEQEYFADGMTEDIITALSHLTALTVIAHNSTFAYKGKSVKVQDVARDLGVRYVLEGSVRRSGQRARITAQLIDAISGHHLWAERYDRNLEDIFDIQDEITRNIAIALQVQLTLGQHARLWQAGTRNFEAWQCQARGVQAFYKTTREGWSEAIECFEKAIAMDPNYVPAWAALGHTHSEAARYCEIADPVASLQRAEEIAEKLLSADESQADGQQLLGNIRLTQRRYEDAVAAGAKAVELDPNNADHQGELARKLVYSGQPKQALQHVNLAIQLSPHYPNWFTSTIFLAHYLQGDFELARKAAEDAVARFPDYPDAYINLTGIYSAFGLANQARDMVSKLLRMKPALSLTVYAKSQVFQDPTDTETWVEHLRKAGLPE